MASTSNVKTRLHALTIALIALSSLAGHATAQDAKKPPLTEFSGDLGFVNVAGNTSVTTLNVSQRYIRRLAPWEFKQDFGTVYGKTDGTESSNLWRASLRADYGLSSHWALYALTAFDRNKFAGIKSRFAEGVGVVAKLIATDVDQLNLEAGFQVTQQKNLDGTDDNFKSLRAATSVKHTFPGKSYIFQSVEVLPNLDESEDLRVNSETAVVAPVSSHIGLKFSYVVRYDNLPALNAAGTAPLQKTDRIFSTGIQITF
jgi:putative salt-induced outer membrane protein YdiY